MNCYFFSVFRQFCLINHKLRANKKCRNFVLENKIEIESQKFHSRFFFIIFSCLKHFVLNSQNQMATKFQICCSCMQFLRIVSTKQYNKWRHQILSVHFLFVHCLLCEKKTHLFPCRKLFLMNIECFNFHAAIVFFWMNNETITLYN